MNFLKQRISPCFRPVLDSFLLRKNVYKMHILFLIIVCLVKIHLNSEIIVIKTVFLSGVLILENQIARHLCFTLGLIDVLLKKRAFEIQLNRCLRESGHFA